MGILFNDPEGIEYYETLEDYIKLYIQPQLLSDVKQIIDGLKGSRDEVFGMIALFGASEIIGSIVSNKSTTQDRLGDLFDLLAGGYSVFKPFLVYTLRVSVVHSLRTISTFRFLQAPRELRTYRESNRGIVQPGPTPRVIYLQFILSLSGNNFTVSKIKKEFSNFDISVDSLGVTSEKNEWKEQEIIRVVINVKQYLQDLNDCVTKLILLNLQSYENIFQVIKKNSLIRKNFPNIGFEEIDKIRDNLVGYNSLTYQSLNYQQINTIKSIEKGCILTASA